MSVVSLWKGAALKSATQLSLLCALFFAKLYHLLIASFALSVELESFLQRAVSLQNGSCHRRVQLCHPWVDMVPRQEAYRENCDLRNPKVGDTI